MAKELIYIHLNRRLVIWKDRFLGKPNGWVECWKMTPEWLTHSFRGSLQGTLSELRSQMERSGVKGWISVSFEAGQIDVQHAVKAIMDERRRAVNEKRPPQLKITI